VAARLGQHKRVQSGHGRFKARSGSVRARGRWAKGGIGLGMQHRAGATVPVPCFLLFLCFRKATQEIFSELDETSS
jgi:hypothetical protein